jgi:putative tryptophan/tyrosine transport system substrate-binding protein
VKPTQLPGIGRASRGTSCDGEPNGPFGVLGMRRIRRGIRVRITVSLLAVAVALLLLVAPLTTEGQAPAKVARIGVIAFVYPKLFREGLRELGYVEGQNLAFEVRGGDDEKRFAEFAAELVRLRVDLIVAGNNPAIQAAQKATSTIPIVMVQSTDPVSLGFVASLARPGGNITGLTVQAPDLAAKRLQLLKEVVPTLSRVGILWDPAPGWGRHMFSGAEAVAPTLGVQLQLVEVRSPNELESAFAALLRERAGAIFYPGSTWQGLHRVRIAEDAINRILKGATPAGLAVEQPTKFELVINMKTAKRLELTIPQSVLLRTHEMIE